MPRKILIVGAKGQLGTAISKLYAGGKNILTELDVRDLDITDKGAVQKAFDVYKPDVVINCAAYNDVEAAPLNIEKAFNVNALGPYYLASAVKALNATLVHVSTDYVFDGSKKFFKEDDAPHPLNVYGASKLAGEELVLMVNPKIYLVRTSWLFGVSREPGAKNFVTTMIKKSKEGGIIRVVNDQIGSTTYAPDLALKIKELVEKQVNYGIYHITGSGSCSWYEFAREIFKILKIKAAVQPISTSESGTKVNRPKFSVLKNARMLKSGLKPMRNWKSALSVYLKEISL